MPPGDDIRNIAFDTSFRPVLSTSTTRGGVPNSTENLISRNAACDSQATHFAVADEAARPKPEDPSVRAPMTARSLAYDLCLLGVERTSTAE